MTTTPKTTNELIEECQGLVRSLAWKARAGLPRQVDLDDLIGYGQVGLAEAANAYDPSRNVKFATFAYYRVRGAIYDGITMMSWFRQSPSTWAKYEQATNEILQGDGSEQDDSQETTLEDEARWLKSIAGRLAVAYLATGPDDSRSNEESQLVDESTPSPQTALCEKEVCRKLRALIDALPGQEGILIRAAYYEGLSLKEAARRIGVSKSWASRLHAKTLKRLANSLRQMGITE